MDANSGMLNVFKSVPLSNVTTCSGFPDANSSSVCDEVEKEDFTRTSSTANVSNVVVPSEKQQVRAKQVPKTGHRLQSIVSNIWCKTLAQEVPSVHECVHQDKSTDSVSHNLQPSGTVDEEVKEVERDSGLPQNAASRVLHDPRADRLTDPSEFSKDPHESCSAGSRCDTIEQPMTSSRLSTVETSPETSMCIEQWPFEQKPDTIICRQPHVDRKLYRCEFCDKFFNWQSGLARHRRFKHPGAHFYNCDICGMEFSRSDSLAKHRRCHTGEQPHSCEVCSKTFTYPSQLERHRVTHHAADVKPVACDILGDDSISESDALHICTGEGAETHREHQTSKKRGWTCNICNRKFRNASTLSIHTRMHLGEKPYQCNTCFKAFTRLAHLTQHERIHTGDRPFKCEMCDKSFTLPGTLVEHKRTHTGEKPYKCDMCGIAFSRRHYLRSHKRVHASDRPFQCYICNVAFNRPQNLTTHIRVHVDGKAYKCEICDKRFTRLSGLSNHRRNIRQCRPKCTDTELASSSDAPV